MIILDTNVVSELMRPKASAEVLAWANDQDLETLHLSVVSLGELRFGICALPHGRRREDLERRLQEMIAQVFKDRLLDFDAAAASLYGERRAAARAAGRAVAVADGMIAATAAARGWPVATRDSEPFEGMGVDVIDPWTA